MQARFLSCHYRGSPKRRLAGDFVPRPREEIEMSKKLEIRLSEILAEKLDKYANKTGLTKSELVRYLLAFQIDKAPSKEDIRRLQRELASIGNNLNQIARALNRCVKENEQISTEFIEKTVTQVYELMSLLDSYKK